MSLKAHDDVQKQPGSVSSSTKTSDTLTLAPEIRISTYVRSIPFPLPSTTSTQDVIAPRAREAYSSNPIQALPSARSSIHHRQLLRQKRKDSTTNPSLLFPDAILPLTFSNPTHLRSGIPLLLGNNSLFHVVLWLCGTAS